MLPNLNRIYLFVVDENNDVNYLKYFDILQKLLIYWITGALRIISALFPRKKLIKVLDKLLKHDFIYVIVRLQAFDLVVCR